MRTWARHIGGLLLMASFSLTSGCMGHRAGGVAALTYDDSLFARVRVAGRAADADLPVSLNVLKFADELAPLSALIAGGDTQRVVVAYPAFQIRYDGRWIMVDAGADQETFIQVDGPDSSGHYWHDRYDEVQRALRDADRIVLTHEHYDHAEGIERSPYLNQVVPHTLLTVEQVASLVAPPAPKGYISLSRNEAAAYQTIDYTTIHPLSPGVVLIKAPGHSPGAQFVYVRLRSGREVLLIGDLVWNMAGLERNVQKPEATIKALKEDEQAVALQIAWIRGIMAGTNVVVVPCHDDRRLEALVSGGVLGRGLDLSR